MNSQRILITGSEGFIGKALSRRLSSSPGKYELFTLDRNGFGTNHRVVDITSKQLDLVITEINADTIIHLAGNVSVKFSIENPLDDLKVNALGTLAIVKSALKTRCRNIIYINSGGAIYDSSAQLPFDEKTPTKPVSPYGLSKLIGEQYLSLLADGHMSWTSLALSNCYGSVQEQKKGFIYSMWRDLSAGISPKINGATVSRDFIYIEDVLDAIELAIKNPANCRLNISSNRSITLLELFSKLSKALASSLEPEILPSLSGEVADSCLDNSLAMDVLGWKPRVGIDEGLRLSLLSNNSI
jgi:UDP-glucose 4-epimerase